MRYYAFYLTVALLAFGIGICFFYIYLPNDAEIVSESVNWSNKETSQTVPTNRIKEQSETKKSLTDKEKAILLYQPTLDRWLSNQKLDEIVEPSTEIIRKITDGELNVVDKGILLHSSQKSYKPSLIDVNNDGKDELAILSNCSPPEYCELWVFMKTSKSFEVILSTYTTVEDFSLRESKTKGYFDIQTTRTYSKSETTLGITIYKFDGKEYVGRECYDYIYLYKNKNGTLQKLNKPKLIPLHCC